MFAKKLLGESEIQAVLQRLDRLTRDEARMTGAETLQVVHGLITNMKLIMDGTHVLFRCRWFTRLDYYSNRWQVINGQHTADAWYVWSMTNDC